METDAFGRTGVALPLIGQGTWNIGDDTASEAREVDALRAGLDLGLTHIDTAEMYGDGRSERLVARAIAGRRHEVFLASKVLPSNASRDGTVRACERSLRRLGTDYLDLYLLHWPSGQHAIAETMGALEELVAAGKTRFIGVSNFSVGELRVAQRCLSAQRIACNQVLYHLGGAVSRARSCRSAAGKALRWSGMRRSPRGSFRHPTAGSARRSRRSPRPTPRRRTR